MCIRPRKCRRAGRFDFAYTGIGALSWLPDIRRWAEVVAGLLRASGRLFLREGHPMLLAVDDALLDRLAVDYPYFERDEPMVFDEPGSYVDTEATFAARRYDSNLWITHSPGGAAYPPR